MMKIITTILLFVFANAKAETYYVSNSGSNAATGLIGAPWQTLAKAISVLTDGDSCLLNKGDSWNEKLTPPASNIYFGSYGSGNKPIITGFQVLSGWTNNGNIWSSTFVNSVKYQNTVFINGALRAKGRYPNYGYLIINANATKNQLTGSLSGTPNYTGGEVVIRTNNYTLDKGFITSQVDSVINFTPSTYYNLSNGHGYFIQNIQSVLDTLNEWCYDTTTKTIKVFANTEPIGMASSIDTMVSVFKKQNLKFEGIDFRGANITFFQVDSSSNINISNCTFQYGLNGVTGKAAHRFTSYNNTITDMWNNGIILLDFANSNTDNDSTVIEYNTVSNIGTKAGMGKLGFQSYTAVEIFGDKSVIKNNTIKNVGYIGIWFRGDSFLVKNNFIDTFCFVKDDGGGIYSWSGALPPKTGMKIIDNIILNGLRATAGTNGFIGTAGIFLDNETTNVLIDGNTTYNPPLGPTIYPSFGLLLHQARYITVTNNNFVNTGLTVSILPAVQSNIIFKRNKSFFNSYLYFSVTYVRKETILQMDSNYYCNLEDTNKIVSLYSLSGWQAFSGFDLNSGRKPNGITGSDPILKYNNTMYSKVFPLTGTYRNFQGHDFINSIVLAPFKSEILFKASVDLVPPINYNYTPFRKMKIKKIKL